MLKINDSASANKFVLSGKHYYYGRSIALLVLHAQKILENNHLHVDITFYLWLVLRKDTLFTHFACMQTKEHKI